MSYPDYILAGMIKGDVPEESKKAPNIGGAWKNEDGSIYLRIDPFVVIKGGDDRVLLTLFPYKKRD